MTKTLFRVICTDAVGARNPNSPEHGLQDGMLYDVVADVKAAATVRKPDGDASGYFVRNSETGVVLPQLYRRDRFIKEGAQSQTDQVQSAGRQSAYDPCGTGLRTSANESVGADLARTSVPATGQGLGVGDVVICIDAVGARSFSQPETMLEQDEEYEITADVTDAVTVRKPDGGSSGFMVKRTEDDVQLAGVWNRRRFALSDRD